MKKHLLLFIFFICCNTNAQIKATIIAKIDSTPIPYVNIWIENENIGATSNADGVFEITTDTTDKNIVFSALGYQTLTIPVNEIKDNVTLINSAEELDEVVLIKRKNELTKIVGYFKKKDVKNNFASGVTPWIVARYFPYKEEYAKTPFLKELGFITNTRFRKSKAKIGKVNLRFYSVDKNGFPGDYLHDENILVSFKRGKQITIADLSDFNILIPKDGFFVAIEWLIVEDNYYEFEASITNSKKKTIIKGYNPSIGTIGMNTNEYSFIYRLGKWSNVWKNIYSTHKEYKDKYLTVAMKLHLSN